MVVKRCRLTREALAWRTTHPVDIQVRQSAASAAEKEQDGRCVGGVPGHGEPPGLAPDVRVAMTVAGLRTVPSRW